MVTREVFAETCRRVCEEQGWELTPKGIRVQLAKNRQQVVELEPFEHDGVDLMRLRTTIGSTERMTPVRLTIALRINAELAHGAFAVKDDSLVMVDTLLLGEAEAGEIEASIRYLAETADFYEKTIFETDEH